MVFSNRARVLAVGLVVGMAGLSCSKPAQDPSDELSNQAANESIEVRLKKTSQVKVYLSSVMDALRPVATVLKDASKALDAQVSVDGKTLDPARLLVDRLMQVLEEGTRGLATVYADGSWTIERTIRWPFDRAIAGCEVSFAVIYGRRVADHEELSLELVDCASAVPLTLADIQVYKDQLELAVYPKAVEKLLSTGVKAGGCLVSIDSSSYSTLVCEPMSFLSGDTTVAIDPLMVALGDGHLSGQVRAVARKADGKLVFDAEYRILPGQQPRIEIKTQE